RQVGYEWNVNAGFKNFWNAGTGGGFGWLTSSSTMLRAAPAMDMPASWRYRINFSTDNRKTVSFSAGTFMHGMQEDASLNINYNMGITIRPLNTLRISISPGYSVRNDEFQYITRRSFNDQDRYIFGKIDQKVLNMSLRINYNITPDLTVQYWGQPFIATGKYSKIKMITDPVADELSDRYHLYTDEQINMADGYYYIDEDTDSNTDYGFGNPDFNVDEWISNLVVRWEFLPGSTAFLVWSQSRNYYSPDGEFEVMNNLSDLFTDKKANNVFLVKVSYRFGLR
ncbi:MAG: DUF5916 domain-containing protein, partial [Bacteroidales bacterium]